MPTGSRLAATPVVDTVSEGKDEAGVQVPLTVPDPEVGAMEEGSSPPSSTTPAVAAPPDPKAEAVAGAQAPMSVPDPKSPTPAGAAPPDPKHEAEPDAQAPLPVPDPQEVDAVEEGSRPLRKCCPLLPH